MAATQAKGGFGAKLMRNDGTGTYVEIAEVLDINGPSRSQVIEDATHMASPSGFVERIGTGVKDGGQVTFTVHLLQDDATQNTLASDLESSVKHDYWLLLPGATKKYTFSALVSAMGMAIPMKGKMTHDVTFDITGPVTKAAHP